MEDGPRVPAHPPPQASLESRQNGEPDAGFLLSLAPSSGPHSSRTSGRRPRRWGGWEGQRYGWRARPTDPWAFLPPAQPRIRTASARPPVPGPLPAAGVQRTSLPSRGRAGCSDGLMVYKAPQPDLQMSRKMGSVYIQVTLSRSTWSGTLQGAGAPGYLMSKDMQKPCGWFFLWESLEAREELWLSVCASEASWSSQLLHQAARVQKPV